MKTFINTKIGLRILMTAIIGMLYLIPCDMSAQEDDRRDRKTENKDKPSRLKDFKKESDSDEDGEETYDSGGNGFLTEMLLNVGFELLKAGLFNAGPDSTSFQMYPYQEGESFAMPGFTATVYRPGFGQARVYYHYLDQDLTAAGFTLRGRLNSQFGVSLDFTQFREDMLNQPDEKLFMYRVGIIKSLIINEILIWDLDIGFRGFNEYGGGDAGLRFQVFPDPPFVLNFWSSFGATENEFLMELQPSAGFLLGRFQIDLGYRYIKWGDETLKGVITGLKIWF
jgi:hypothetical protein